TGGNTMEKPMANEWKAAVKKSKLLSDSGVEIHARVIGKYLDTRAKLITGLIMALQGIKASRPPLMKTYKSLQAEAKANNDNIAALVKEFKEGSKAQKLAKGAAKAASSFLVRVSDNDLGSNIIARYEAKAGATAEQALKQWQDLMKMAKKMPRPVKKELENNKSSVEKLLKRIKGQVRNVQEAHKAILGCNSKLRRDELKMEIPLKALRGALKDIVAKDPGKKKAAVALGKHLDGIEKTMHDFTF
ncbi:MAG: hypothetical protein L3K26_05115, partial [Candidatus Hydrogenedentes bacterium]|nr:hypothetical protein [Candidatus Hydrogenedentota bacterium]